MKVCYLAVNNAYILHTFAVTLMWHVFTVCWEFSLTIFKPLIAHKHRVCLFFSVCLYLCPCHSLTSISLYLHIALSLPPPERYRSNEWMNFIHFISISTIFIQVGHQSDRSSMMPCYRIKYTYINNIYTHTMGMNQIQINHIKIKSNECWIIQH